MLPASSPRLIKQKHSSPEISNAISLLIDARSLLLRTRQRLAISQSTKDTQRRIDEAIKAIDTTGIQLDSTRP